MAKKRIDRRHKFRGFTTVGGREQLYDLDLVKQDLLNHLNTQKGERVMDPTFGSIIWDLLFDNFTEYTKEKIIEDTKFIVENEPRLALDSIIVDEFEHGIIVQLDITYTPDNLSETLAVQFDQRTLER